MLFSNHSFLTALWCGCAITDQLIIKLITCTIAHYALSIRIILPHLKNFQQKMALSLFIIKTYIHLPLKCIKLLKGWRHLLWRTFLIYTQNFDSENVSARTRHKPQFYNPNNPKKVNTGLQTLGNLGPQIWDMVPNDIKLSPSLISFKNKIRKWVPTDCPCRLCAKYVANLGFIQEISVGNSHMSLLIFQLRAAT